LHTKSRIQKSWIQSRIQKAEYKKMSIEGEIQKEEKQNEIIIQTADVFVV